MFILLLSGGVGGECKKPLRMATGRSGWTSGIASSRRERCLAMWPIERAWSGKLWPLSCFIVDGATQLAAGGEGGAGRRETCGHHGLCAGMEGTEPCPRSSSTTTKTFSLTLSQPSGTGPRRFGWMKNLSEAHWSGGGGGGRLRLRKDLKVAPTWQTVQSNSAYESESIKRLVFLLKCRIFIFSVPDRFLVYAQWGLQVFTATLCVEF